MRGAWWLFAVVLLGAAGAAAWLVGGLRDGSGTHGVDAGEVERTGGHDEQPTRSAGVEAVDAEKDEAALAWGRRFLWDAIGWVERDGEPVERVWSFHALLDVRLLLASGSLTAPVEVWYRAPDRFRLERETNAGIATVVLVGDRGWRVQPSGRVEEVTAASGPIWGEPPVGYVRDLFYDVVSIVSLRPLARSDARLTFAGYKRGSGTYAGRWIKVTRRVPEKACIHVWMAYERTGEQEVRATWPGIVRVEGDPQRDRLTEDYVLREWDAPHVAHAGGRRHPRRVECYAITDEEPGRRVPRRFLFAVVDELQVKGPVDDRLFEAPVEED